MKFKILVLLKRFGMGLSVFAIIITGFYANEAKKEIYFLCGNFKPDVAYSSVIKQLDTATLSEYTVVSTPMGTSVVQSSSLHFHLISCTIEFNAEKIVVAASYR